MTLINGQETRNLYWVANYEDGSQLKQFENGKENRYADIDREKLVRFDMVDVDTGKAVYALYVHEGEKLIYRRRTIKYTNGMPDTIVYLVGYQVTIMTDSGPRKRIVINYLHPDGSIALDNERHNIELLAIEQ